MHPASKPVEEIFLDAVRRSDSADRAAYLLAACGGDHQLRSRVETLLKAHADTGGSSAAPVGVLEATIDCGEDQPAAAPPQAGAGSRQGTMEKPGDSIGRYKLLQQIGEGGFGAVYMAEQQHPVRRRVALKVIKAGMDTHGVIARFEAERQALAMMDHPNIARVFDAGATDAGRPYFVMELVKGISITAFCDEQRFDTGQRLELFADVCSAINHAHQKGIIHRDIKPSNVLVTLHGDKPVVKVIDFGIAKATDGSLTDKTLFTQFNQFIGTPAYMSPEQAATSGLDIDTRSDIYSLGVLLYELLTGGPPFDAKTLVSGGYDEMRRMIRESEPPRPSARLSTAQGDLRQSLAKARQAEPDRLGRIVEPDLDWIVMKAIDKDRARRYETANAMALDIQRFLSDEPVTATPPSTRYRFSKFVRRNRTAFRIAAAVVVLLIAGVAVSTWQAIRATRAEALANERSEQTAREAIRATQAEKLAIERSELAAKEALRATQAERLANDRSEQAAREAERATKAEKLATERLAQVAAERDAKDQARQNAQGLATFLQNVLVSPNPDMNGRDLRVVDLLDQAASLLDSELSTQPDQKATFQRALGGVYVALGLPKQGMPLLERSYDYWLKTVGPEHQNTLDVMTALSHAYDEVGRYVDALALREELLVIQKRQKGPEHPDVLWTMTHIASSYHQMQRLDDALKLREEVLAIWKRTVGLEDPSTLAAMHNLVQSYLTANRAEEALKLAGQVRDLRRKINGPSHPDTIRAMINLSSAYQQVGHDDDAIKGFEEAAALANPVLGPEHPLSLKISNALAGLYGAHERLDECVRLNERLIELYTKVKGADHEETLGVQSNLAMVYSKLNRLKDAIPLQERTLAAMRRALPANHPFTEITMEGLVILYETDRRSKDSIALAEELVELRRKKYGNEDSRTLEGLKMLALCQFNARQLDDAIPNQQKLVSLRKRINGPSSDLTLEALNHLAVMFETAKRYKEAVAPRDEALALTRTLRSPDHRDTALALTAAASSHLLAEDQLVALKLREEALPIYRKVFGPEHSETLALMSDIAISYGNIDRKDRAIQLQIENVAQMKRLLPQDHQLLRVALGHLIWLYNNTSQPELASKVQDELHALEAKK